MNNTIDYNPKSEVTFRKFCKRLRNGVYHIKVKEKNYYITMVMSIVKYAESNISDIYMGSKVILPLKKQRDIPYIYNKPSFVFVYDIESRSIKLLDYYKIDEAIFYEYGELNLKGEE